MLRGEADLALPQLKPHPTSQNLDNGSGRGLPGGGKLLGRHVSSYARITIARLASQARGMISSRVVNLVWCASTLQEKI